MILALISIIIDESSINLILVYHTCRPFGRIEQTDIRRRPDHNDAFAFVVFEDISDSMRAVKSLGSSTDINGVECKIGYSTSSKVRTIL